MNPITWAEAFKSLLEARGVEHGQGSRNDLTSVTVAEVAAELGVPERTARIRLGWADTLKDEPELKAKVHDGKLSALAAVKQAKKKRDRKERQAEAEQAEPVGEDLLGARRRDARGCQGAFLGAERLGRGSSFI